MKLSELSPDAIRKIKSYRWDRIIEKHEGPESWESDLKYFEPEFMNIGGHDVLLPIDKKFHRNITILRCLKCEDGKVLTIFLKDTTYSEHPSDCGFVTVCEKIPGEEFHIAVLYHEWFILENPS